MEVIYIGGIFYPSYTFVIAEELQGWSLDYENKVFTQPLLKVGDKKNNMTLSTKDDGILVFSDLFQETTARAVISATYNCCSEKFSEDIVFNTQTCWYNLTFESELAPNKILTELLVSDGSNSILLVGGPTAYDLADDNHVSILETHINNWLVTEGYNGSFRVIKSEGLDVDSKITLQFNGTLTGLQPNLAYVGDLEYSFSTCPSSHSTINVIDGMFCIGPDFFKQTELKDGIYRITVVSESLDGSLVEETSCFFKKDAVKCDIVKAIEEENFQAHRLYEAIEASIECDDVDCDCKQACSLFESLIDSLGKTSSDDSTTDCGCQ